MTSQAIVYLTLGGLAGGFINGFSGTGTALFALGFLLAVLTPQQAVAVVALISVLAGLQGLWVVRRSVAENPRRILRFLLPGLAGVPIGIFLLQYVDATILRLLVATMLVVYGAFFGFRANLPRMTRVTPVTDLSIGFAGGVLGGLASLSGALPVIWLSMRPWPKEQTRAVLQSFNVVILSTTVVLLFLTGAYSRETWIALAVALPAGLLAAQLGIFVFRQLSDDQFRRTLIILCLAMGLGIFATTLGIF